MRPTRATRNTVLALAACFLSGFCGLLYEVVWERWLELQIGVSTYAVALIVSVFMAGLALGAAAFGAICSKTKPPLRIYAAIEIAVAIVAFAVPRLFGSTLTGLFVLTVLMGGTLPVLAQYLAAESEVGLGVAAIYGVNTLGAVAGCFATGFLLIPNLGLSNTNLIGVAGNLAAGIGVLCLPTRATAPRPAAAPEESPVHGYSRQEWGLLLIAAICGFTGLGYEVLWFRTLRLVIGSTVYAFSTMLTMFLLGIALGSLLTRYWLRRQRGVLVLLGLTQAALGLSAWLTFPGCSATWTLLSFWSQSYNAVIGHWALARLTHFMIAATTLLVPTLCLGISFPLIVELFSKRRRGAGAALGSVYFANAVGSIAGSLGIAFLILPWLGLRRAILLLVGMNIALGLAMLAASSRRALAAAASIIILAVGLTWGDLWISDRDNPAMLYYHDGVAALISVYKEGGQKLLATDNLSVQGGDPASPTKNPKRLGYLPRLLHPKADLGLVLQIGLGTGINLSALAEGAAETEVVEIIPELPETARFFRENNNDVLLDPKVHLIIDDGRHHIRTSTRPYDLIVGDLFFPENAGTGNLYSREHFARSREALSDSGMMVQWVPLQQVSMDVLKSIMKTFAAEFPHVSLWWGTISKERPVVGLVGTVTEQRISPRELSRRMKLWAPALAKVGWTSPSCVMNQLIMSEGKFREFSSLARENTDDRPYIEFAAPRLEAVGERIATRNIVALGGLPPACATAPASQTR